MFCKPDKIGAGSGSEAETTPWVRWSLLSACPIVELLAIGILFEGEVLEQKDEVWARFLEFVPRSVSVCLAITAALIAVGRSQVLRALAGAHLEFGCGRPWKTLIFAHWLAFGGLIGIGKLLFETGPKVSGSGTELCMLGCVLAVAAISLWALAILPARGWKKFCWDCRHALAAAIPFGLLAQIVATLTAKVGWDSLSETTILWVHRILALIYTEVVYDPANAVVGTPSFAVRIGTACAGYEGIGLILVFLTGYLWVARRRLRFPLAFVLLPVGAMLSLAANIIRIALLVAIGTGGFPEVALGGFHSQAGWLTFITIALGLIAGAERSTWLAAEHRPHGGINYAEDRTVAYLAPFLGVVATAMITAAMSAGFDWLYGLRVLVAAALLAYFWPAYSMLSSPWSWQALVLGGIGFVVWIALVPGGTITRFPVTLQTASATSVQFWLALRFVGYIVTGPIVEELAFRGFLLRRFTSVDFNQVPLNRFHWQGFLGSSIAFGGMHGHNWLPASAAGMLFALAAYRRGNLGEAIVAHGATNAAISCYALLTGDWQRLG